MASSSRSLSAPPNLLKANYDKATQESNFLKKIKILIRIFSEAKLNPHGLFKKMSLVDQIGFSNQLEQIKIYLLSIMREREEKEEKSSAGLDYRESLFHVYFLLGWVSSINKNTVDTKKNFDAAYALIQKKREEKTTFSNTSSHIFYLMAEHVKDNHHPESDAIRLACCEEAFNILKNIPENKNEDFIDEWRNLQKHITHLAHSYELMYRVISHILESRIIKHDYRLAREIHETISKHSDLIRLGGMYMGEMKRINEYIKDRKNPILLIASDNSLAVMQHHETLATIENRYEKERVFLLLKLIFNQDVSICIRNKAARNLSFIKKLGNKKENSFLRAAKAIVTLPTRPVFEPGSVDAGIIALLELNTLSSKIPVKEIVDCYQKIHHLVTKRPYNASMEEIAKAQRKIQPLMKAILSTFSAPKQKIRYDSASSSSTFETVRSLAESSDPDLSKREEVVAKILACVSEEPHNKRVIPTASLTTTSLTEQDEEETENSSLLTSLTRKK